MDNMLGAAFVGPTMVGGDQQVVLTDAGGGVAHGETRVHGALALGYGFGGAISGSTAVAASVSNIKVAVSGTVSDSTTVHGDLTISILRGQVVTAGTIVSGEYPTGTVQLRATSIGRTSTHGQLTGQWQVAGAVTGRATVQASLRRLAFLTTGSITAGTTVQAVAPDIYLLPGAHLLLGTGVVARLNEKLTLTPRTVAARTTVRGGLARQYTFGGDSMAGSTSVKARMHNYPTDFYDLTIYTGTIAAGAINLTESIKGSTTSPVQGKTKVNGKIGLKFKFVADQIKAATKLKVYLRYGTGSDLIMRTSVTSRLGILTGIHSWKGQTIKGKTVVTAQPPENRFKGLAAGKTTLSGHLTIEWGVAGYIAMYTALHTHYSGRNAHDGTVGFVDLITLPAGDMGTPDEISGSTVPTADITVERHRVLTVFGNAGVSVERELVAHGTASAGPGTRYIGEPWDPPVPVKKRLTYYV